MGKVRKKNLIRRNLILRALLDHGQLSLTELKLHTGISLPVVTSIVNFLKEDNLLIDVESRGPSQAGRPPSLVALNGAAGYILGIDLGRTNSNFILLDLAQNLVADVRTKSLNLSNEISIIEDLHREIDSILENADVSWDRILGIGISVPGLVQGQRGISETYLNFGDRPVAQVLSERFGKPVHIEHDAKAMTLGEMWFGAAKGRQNVLCLNVGWGLGLGMIINGRLHYGMNGYAGEFGHLQIVPDGLLCYCGKRGCLEMYASGKAIARNARDKIEKGAMTNLATPDGKEVDRIDAKRIIEAANGGDQFCIEIIEEAAGYLGFGIAQLLNIFNPELVIFGGRISPVKFFLNPAISAAVKHSMTHLNKNVSFETSKLGAKSGALGVAVLAARELFEVEHLNPSAYV
ncbi:ROK family protein [bacterium]|nr:ROK family protein [bacterium]